MGPGCVKTICVARESRILSNEQMSRHSDFATDGKKQSRFALVRADLEFSHSLDPNQPFRSRANASETRVRVDFSAW